MWSYNSVIDWWFGDTTTVMIDTIDYGDSMSFLSSGQAAVNLVYAYSFHSLVGRISKQ